MIIVVTDFKGIPKSCSECNIWDGEYGLCCAEPDSITYDQSKKARDNYRNERPPWCPLREINTPIK